MRNKSLVFLVLAVALGLTGCNKSKEEGVLGAEQQAVSNPAMETQQPQLPVQAPANQQPIPAAVQQPISSPQQPVVDNPAPSADMNAPNLQPPVSQNPQQVQANEQNVDNSKPEQPAELSPEGQTGAVGDVVPPSNLSVAAPQAPNANETASQ